MDTLCRVCIEKVEKCTSLCSKIEDSSKLSFLDFLNKCTTLNAREGDRLPQGLCSVCVNAMRTFYSIKKLAEKSDLILREALARKNSTKSLYNLDFVKEEPQLSESTPIVPAINGSGHCESNNLNHPKKNNEVPDDMLSRRDRRLAGIAKVTVSDIPKMALKRILAKREDEADSPRNPCEEVTIRNETVEEESEDFSQGDSFSCQPSINSTGSLPYILDIVKEEPRVYEGTSVVNVKDGVIDEIENSKSYLDHPKWSDEELDDISSCKNSRLASDTERSDSDDDVPIGLLKKRLEIKDGDETDSQRNSFEEITRNDTMAHRCELCGKKFRRKKNLNKHLRSHKGPIKCQKCGKEFNKFHRLRLHLNSHSDPLKRVKCKQCGKKLKHRHSLRRHMQLHTNPKQFKCEHCNKSFVKESSCSNHSCHGRKKFECEICGKKLSRDYLERYHMESHKGITRECNVCGKEFTYRDSLSRHMKLHETAEACTCETCGKSLSSKESYARHRDIFHPEQAETSKHHCGACGRSFSTKYYLDLHMEIHKGTKHKCDKCGKEFKHRETLNRHMKLHNNPNACNCEICGKMLRTKDKYTRHMHLYHSEQSKKTKINCAICGKNFNTKYYLNIHMGDHEGITPKCDECGKEFTNKISLSRHMKLHNNPTPFKCEKCGRYFDRRYRYNSHVKICKNAGKPQQLKTEQLPIHSKTEEVVISHESAALI